MPPRSGKAQLQHFSPPPHKEVHSLGSLFPGHLHSEALSPGNLMHNKVKENVLLYDYNNSFTYTSSTDEGQFPQNL